MASEWLSHQTRVKGGGMALVRYFVTKGKNVEVHVNNSGSLDRPLRVIIATAEQLCGVPHLKSTSLLSRASWWQCFRGADICTLCTRCTTRPPTALRTHAADCRDISVKRNEGTK